MNVVMRCPKCGHMPINVHIGEISIDATCIRCKSSFSGIITVESDTDHMRLSLIEKLPPLGVSVGDSVSLEDRTK